MIQFLNFNTLCILWSIIALITFVFLLFVTAPYGRYTRKGWGLLVDNRLGWIIMELPSFLIIFLFTVISIRNSYALFLAGIWLFHYFYRTFLFPFKLHTKGKKMPLSIIVSAIVFNSVNATLNGYYLSEFASYEKYLFFKPLFFIGILIIVAGTFIHMKSDKILIDLRKPGETGYKIPEGFMFRYLSCPNFLGEIMVWGGFVLLAWNMAALSFLAWTLANLLPRGIKHHKWYKEHFEDYPSNRKALIPFLL